MEMAYIYVIKDPDTLQVVYVGQTLNLKTRIQCHLSIKKGKRSDIQQYLYEIQELNKKPFFEIYKRCDRDNRWKEESLAFFEFKKRGCMLLNKNSILSNAYITQQLKIAIIEPATRIA